MSPPSTPQRKSANVNVSPVNVSGGNNNSVMPTTKSATPFGSVTRESVLPVRSANVSPTGVPTNDKDAGRGTGNVR